MNLKFFPLCIMLLFCSCVCVIGQNQYPIPSCNFSKSQKFVGDRLRLPLPKGATVKRGHDVDYSDYYIGFGKKENRVWLSGIFGPTATTGKVSEKWLSSSNEIIQRTFKFGDYEGLDAKGTLKNGNYWRYIGIYGESINYYDVNKDAADYFDSIIQNLCYQEWEQ